MTGRGFTRTRAAVRTAAAAFLLAALSAPATADPAWPETVYPYTVIDQDIGTVLQQFSDNIGTPLRISEDVRGRVQDFRSRGTPEDFLNELSRQYDFEWYFDGYFLHVSDNDESVARLLSLGQVPFVELETALLGLGIADDRFPLRHGAGSDLVFVSGPPRYVALVEQTLLALVNAAPTQVSIFRGSREPQS